MVMSVFVETTVRYSDTPTVLVMMLADAEDSPQGVEWAQQEANELDADGFLYQYDTEVEEAGEIRMVQAIHAIRE